MSPYPPYTFLSIDPCITPIPGLIHSVFFITWPSGAFNTWIIPTVSTVSTVSPYSKIVGSVKLPNYLIVKLSTPHFWCKDLPVLLQDFKSSSVHPIFSDHPAFRKWISIKEQLFCKSYAIVFIYSYIWTRYPKEYPVCFCGNAYNNKYYSGL